MAIPFWVQGRALQECSPEFFRTLLALAVVARRRDWLAERARGKSLFLGKNPLPKRPDPDYLSSYAEPSSLPPAPSPLAIILATMRRKYAEGDLDGAVSLARIAAPYLHARVPSAVPPTDLSAMPDADLDSLQPPE